MGLTCEWVHYGEEGQHLGMLARPQRAKESLPSVIVIQEIWGVDQHIEDVTRRFASAGYVAFAPDLYAESGERPAALSADRIARVKQFLETVSPAVWNDPKERDAAIAQLPEPDQSEVKATFETLFGARNTEGHKNHLQATVRYLQSECTYSQGQRVGSVGFCMGGALSGALACIEPNLSAAVIFYGARPDVLDLDGIGCPMLGFYGSLDVRITDTIAGLSADMTAKGKQFTAHVYEGAHHAFFNDTRAAYHAAASRDAFAKTLTLFNEALTVR